MRLQLERAARGGPTLHDRHHLPPRERTLLFDHEAQWFGAPFPAMIAGAPERGFFAQIRVTSHASQVRRLVDAPGLRTVRHLGLVRRRIRVRSALHDLLACDGLQHLDRVGTLWPEDLPALVNGAGCPRWITLAPGGPLDDLAEATAKLGRLERLDLAVHASRVGLLAALDVPTLGLRADEWLARDAGFPTTPIPRDAWPDRLASLLAEVPEGVRRVVLADDSEGLSVIRREDGWAIELDALVPAWRAPGDPRFTSVALLKALSNLPVTQPTAAVIYRVTIGELEMVLPAGLPAAPLRVDGGYRQAPRHWLTRLPALPELQFSDQAHRWLVYADQSPRFAQVRLLRTSGAEGPLLWRGDDDRLRYAWDPDGHRPADLERLEAALGHSLEAAPSPP